MFELVFFGTSASAPSIYRGLAGQAVLAGEHRYLVDCGEGTQRQILRSGIGFKRLNRILLTHAHLDHILGLGGLVSTLVHWEAMDEIEIWGGRATLDRVSRLLFDIALPGGRTPIPIHLIDIPRASNLLTTKQYTISAFPVQHRGPDCFGFIFKEHDHSPFLVEKAEALGIPAGPERGRLVRGETITLADGRTITPEMVLGETERGVKLVITGDVGRTDNLVEAVRDADVLVIEATFLHRDAAMAAERGHITARQAAELAVEANVRHLILTHVSRRYRERDIIAEAQAVFHNTIVARDLDHYSIRRGQPLQKIEPETQLPPEGEAEVDEDRLPFPDTDS